MTYTFSPYFYLFLQENNTGYKVYIHPTHYRLNYHKYGASDILYYVRRFLNNMEIKNLHVLNSQVAIKNQ